MVCMLFVTTEAGGHHGNHTSHGDDQKYTCKCMVYSTDGSCPATEPAVKWKLAEKSMYEDKKGNRRPPTKVFEGDIGCCQFTVPLYVKNNSDTKFKDNCDKHFTCPDFKEETKSNMEKAGAQIKTKAYSCSKTEIDEEKLCACSTKGEIQAAKRNAENLLLIVGTVAAIILCTFCCCLCYCRRRMKRSGAQGGGSKKPTSNPYLK